MATEIIKPDQINASFQVMTQLPILRQLSLLAGLAASIALGVYIVLWSQSPAYSVLYHQLSARDASDITTVLQAENIRYQVDTTAGVIMVDSSKVHKARMALAAQSLPRNAGSGFELIEKLQGTDTSNFVQTAIYQHALEGELARTIMAMSAVGNARVHLALPEQSGVLSDRRKPSASVLIELAAGRRLEDEQISAIMHLVASSVPNMESDEVTLVDSKGHLLSMSDTSTGPGLSSRQFEYKRQVESGLVENIEGILIPIVGPNKVRAQVAAEMDFTHIETTKEPSEQAPGQTGKTAQVNKTSSPSKSTVRSARSNELDRSIVHKKQGPGSIKRISVAVIVDNKQTKNDKGELVSTTYTEDELKRFTAIVKEAVGFRAIRGDSVNVINAEFMPLSKIGPAGAETLLKQPWVWDLGKQILGGALALGIALLILRPMMRNLSAIPKLTTGAGTSGDGQDEDQPNLTDQQRLRLSRANKYQSDLEMAKSMVVQDPKRVAQVMKTWVNEG